MHFSKIQGIQSILETELPGEESHSLLMPVNRPYSSEIRKNAEGFRKSAVAIILYEQQNRLESILIQRPKYDGTHSNQIAFPGGKMDGSDPDLEFTARRECMEEVGIPIETPRLIGRLTDIYIPVSKFIVAPHIFHVERLPKLIPDAREVDSIIQFDIEEVLREDVIQSTTIDFGQGFHQKNVPYFSIRDKVVWGATGMMLSELRAILQKV